MRRFVAPVLPKRPDHMSLNSDSMSIISDRTVLSSAPMWTPSSHARVFSASVSVRSSALAGLPLQASSVSDVSRGARPSVSVRECLLAASPKVHSRRAHSSAVDDLILSASVAGSSRRAFTSVMVAHFLLPCRSGSLTSREFPRG